MEGLRCIFPAGPDPRPACAKRLRPSLRIPANPVAGPPPPSSSVHWRRPGKGREEPQPGCGGDVQARSAPPRQGCHIWVKSEGLRCVTVKPKPPPAIGRKWVGRTIFSHDRLTFEAFCRTPPCTCAIGLGPPSNPALLREHIRALCAYLCCALHTCAASRRW